jgi:hypothetical protein
MFAYLFYEPVDFGGLAFVFFMLLHTFLKIPKFSQGPAFHLYRVKPNF